MYDASVSRKAVILVALFVLAVFVLSLLSALGGRLEVTTEWDGKRRHEYRALGIVPVTREESVPTLDVKSIVIAKADSLLQLGAKVDLKKMNDARHRSQRGNDMWFGRVPFRADPNGLQTDIAKKLKNPKKTQSGAVVRLDGESPYGDRVAIEIENKGGGVGELRLWFLDTN